MANEAVACSGKVKRNPRQGTPPALRSEDSVKFRNGQRDWAKTGTAAMHLLSTRKVIGPWRVRSARH